MKMKEKEVNRHFSDLAGMGNLTLPSKLSFAISYNLEKLQKESERIENERKKLCEQYADKDEDGKSIMVKSIINGTETQTYKMSDENRKIFDDEYNDLLNTEVDIEIRTVKSEVVERCEQVERYSIPSVSQLFALSFMLEE